MGSCCDEEFVSSVTSDLSPVGGRTVPPAVLVAFSLDDVPLVACLLGAIIDI